MMKLLVALIATALLGPITSLAAQRNPDPGTLSKAGVIRGAAMVDSVFVDRTLPTGQIDGGDWASYLLARLDAGPMPDGLGIIVRVDTTHINIRGRLQDLPLETRALLGPIAAMVDSSTMIAATVLMQRTGPEILRFWLRSIAVNGMALPEFILGQMMASVGRQYPALTKTGRDLYIQVPRDGVVRLATGAVELGIDPASSTASARSP
ncbi:MAG: hypothetical protein KF785_05540 [Gemmatimonadales bacterium]|nr:hypothetical protein [Gemmatimonadales bacterium]